MHSSTRSQLVLPLVLAAALAGLYFANAGVAEARSNPFGGGRHASSTTATSTKTHLQVDTTCVSAAVEVRETALIAAWSDLHTSLTAALTERKTDFVAAWSLSDATERGKALKTAWDDWKTGKKSAHTEFRSDRKAAWDTFKKTTKDQCKISLPKEEVLEKEAKDTIAI